MAMCSCDGGTHGRLPARTQHPLIRVDSRWEGVFHGYVLRGSWGTWGGNGKDRGFRGWWGVEREVWGAPSLRLPVSLSQAISLLPPHPSAPCTSTLSRWPPSPPFHPPQLSPSLPLSPREVLALLFSELFLESSQLTRLSITKSDKTSLEPQAPFQLPSSLLSSAKAPQSPTCLLGPDACFLPSGHPPHSAPGNFQGPEESSTFHLPHSPLGLLPVSLHSTAHLLSHCKHFAYRLSPSPGCKTDVMI